MIGPSIEFRTLQTKVPRRAALSGGRVVSSGIAVEARNGD